MGWFKKSRDSGENGDAIESWRPARYRDRKSYRRRLMVAYVVASLVHSTIFVLTSHAPASGPGSLNTAGVDETQAEPSPEMPGKVAVKPLRDKAINISFHAPPAEAGPVDGTAGMDQDALESLVDQHQARIEKMSIEEQNAELDRRLDQLSHMKEDDVNAAMGVVEGIMGAPGDIDHKMKPDPSATGEFDAGSMILHQVTKRQDDQGAVVYDYLWVDKAGRTMKQERAAADMDAGERQMAGIYEKAEGNSMLKSMLDWVKRKEYDQLQKSKGR